MDYNSKYKSSEIEEKLDTVDYLKGAIGWSEISHRRFANGTIMTFSPPIKKGQVIMSLQGIGSISLYDENGATKSISTSILPFSVDKTYTKWAAYTSDNSEVTLTVASSVIADLSDVATSGDYNDLNNKPNLDVYATKTELSDKVDKVSGKQLSTEDFTTALKTKLEGLNNYDDTEIENALASLQTQFDTLVSGNASDAINSFNEIIAFLNGIEDSESLDSIIASIEQQIAGKQDNITDLDTIRSGAAKGATALQSYTEKYTGTITEIIMNGESKGTSGVVNLGTVITSHQDISGKADKSSLATVATSGDYSDLNNIPTKLSDFIDDVVVENYLPLSGTAASATKLAANTAYTICGQTFFKNGKPQTVNGTLSGLTEIGTTTTTTTVLGSLVVDKSFTTKSGFTEESGVVGIGKYDGSSSSGTLYLNRKSINYIWAYNTGGYLALGVKDKGTISSGNASLIVEKSSVYPGTDNAVSLGTLTRHWSNFYSYNGNFSNQIFTKPTGAGLIISGRTIALHTNSVKDGDFAMEFGAEYVAFKKRLSPSTNNTYNIGSASYRWAEVYSVKADFSQSVKIGEATLTYANGTLKVDKPFSSAS